MAFRCSHQDNGVLTRIKIIQIVKQVHRECERSRTYDKLRLWVVLSEGWMGGIGIGIDRNRNRNNDNVVMRRCHRRRH